MARTRTEATLGRWVLSIPGWRPALANELRGHPLKAHRRKRRDACTLALAAALAGVPRVAVPPRERRQRRTLGLPATLPGDPAPARRRVGVAVPTPRGRPIDP